MLLVQSVFRIMEFWKITECHWRIQFRDENKQELDQSRGSSYSVSDETFGDLDSLVASRDGESSCFQNILVKVELTQDCGWLDVEWGRGNKN